MGIFFSFFGILPELFTPRVFLCECIYVYLSMTGMQACFVCEWVRVYASLLLCVIREDIASIYQEKTSEGMLSGRQLCPLGLQGMSPGDKFVLR